jgi:hypothetical protein
VHDRFKSTSAVQSFAMNVQGPVKPISRSQWNDRYGAGSGLPKAFRLVARSTLLRRVLIGSRRYAEGESGSQFFRFARLENGLIQPFLAFLTPSTSRRVLDRR